MKKMDIRLTGEKKELQKRLLQEMDKNYREKASGWKGRNCRLSDQIAKLFTGRGRK